MRQEANNNPQERLHIIQSSLDRSIDILGKSGQDPLEIFADSRTKERREDVEWHTEITSDQEEALRANLIEIGIGREENIGPADLEVENGYVAIMEGGQPHKMIAQLNVITGDDQPKPSEIVLTADIGRLLGEAEQQLARNQLGIGADEGLPATEYELALTVASKREDFVAKDNEVSDYDDYTMTHIGSVGGVPVRLMGLKRKHIYPDEPKRFARISNDVKMKIIADSNDVDEIVFVTSGTYRPSNEIQAIKTGENIAGEIFVASYGSKELAAAKGESEVQPVALNQLGAELHKVAKLLK